MAVGWQHYEHVITEHHFQGLLQGPVSAADGAASEIVKQHAAYGRRIVRWVAAAVASNPADLPEVPAAAEFASDAVLLEREVSGQNPVPYDQGRCMYILWGTYTYALIYAKPIDGAFWLGSLPPSFATLASAPVVFPAAKFRKFLDTGKFT